jgi:hypothetical protein
MELTCRIALSQKQTSNATAGKVVRVKSLNLMHASAAWYCGDIWHTRTHNI